MTEEERKEKRKIWEKHLEKWKLSGLSQAEYCRKHKLSHKSFYYWKRKLKSACKTISFMQIPDSAFQESKENQFHSNNTLTVLIADEIKIEVPDNFNPETLKKTVETLRSMG